MSTSATQTAPDWRAAGLHFDDTLNDAITRAATTHANTRAIFSAQDRSEKTTVAALNVRARRIAAGLLSLGLRAGDRIALQIPNCLDGATAYQAAMLLGLVIVPIVHTYGPSETSFILTDSGARVLIVPDRWGTVDYLERIPQFTTSPSLEHIVVIGERAPPGAVLWKTLGGGEAPHVPLDHAKVTADDVALILYTSGTTSKPKGVQHTHNTLLSSLRTERPIAPVISRMVLAPWPSGHSAGLLAMLRLFAAGQNHVIMDRWNASRAGALIGQYGVSESSGAPVMLGELLDLADSGACGISTLKGYLTGGASVPPSLIERADAAGLRPFRCYGSSEHPVISIGSVDDSFSSRVTTDGRITGGAEVRILDDEDCILPAGQTGEIVSRGPKQFIGYRDPALDADAFLPGRWFRTGDIGRLDAEGFLTITDRKKDIIIRGGENISSREIEDIIARDPDVIEVAVVAAPHPRLGEMVCAYVIARPGADISLDGIAKQFGAAGVARIKIPERLELVDSFPRTPAGKVKKFELRNRSRAT